MDDVLVIDDPAAAGVSLDPVRVRLLAALAEPGSATTLATKLELPRQKLNYHLRALEKHGLVELVEERRRGNCTERVLRASASAYVISPRVLAGVQPDPAVSPDGLSARWLLALAARTLREVGELLAGARKARRKLATFAVDGEIRFASAAERAAFAGELSETLLRLTAKYHDESAPSGRTHRLLVAVHPKPSGEHR
ncbi:helix-turn-helix domain-containing protein [Kribbella sancticallisti]|uniref:Helix-turn-helix domain-containing protein n=1 Tax=Kribbella sancticallisti TaxID=460087 RepID=A0ABP4PLK3_9ACTN